MECCIYNLLTILFVILLLIIFKFENPKPLYNVYRFRRGKWFFVKFTIAYLLLRLRKWRLKSSNADKAGYGRKAFDTVEELEKVQPLSSHPKAIDAVFFTGASKDGYYCAVGFARRPNKDVNGFVLLRVPGVGVLQSPRLPDTLLKADNDNSYSGEGIHIKIIKPMRQWTIEYKGKMCLVSDPEKSIQVDFHLTFESQMRYFDFNVDVSPAVMARTLALEPWNTTFFENLRETHQSHYEQMGIMTGQIKLEDQDEPHEVRMSHAFRDHSFSKKRDWKQLHRYVLHNVTGADGTRFMVGMVCMPLSLSVFEYGCLYKPSGQLVSIDWCDFPMWYMGENGDAPMQYGFSFGAGGKTYEVQVDVLEQNELFIGRKWEAKLLERMCHYRVNGNDGWGLSEWEYRNKAGGRPAKYKI